MMRRCSLLLLKCWPLLMVACVPHSRASLYGSQANLTAEDYAQTLDRWTRSDRVYRDFDTMLFVTATLHSSELRRAFALAFPEIYGHGGTITKRELVDLTGDVEQFHNFFIAVYTPNDKWNDLARPDSIWHLTLIGSDDKVAVDLSSIETVKIDANLREVYPYLSQFDKAYLVRFPLTDAMHHLVLEPQSTRATLRMASALGVAEMHWELQPAP
jgi:hypothetical protein